MTALNDADTAVILQRLTGIDNLLAEMRAEQREARTAAVPLFVWEQRNKHVDERLQGLGREIGDIRATIAAARAPWWSTWTVALAAGGLALSILQPFAP